MVSVLSVRSHWSRLLTSYAKVVVLIPVTTNRWLIVLSSESTTLAVCEVELLEFFKFSITPNNPNLDKLTITLKNVYHVGELSF